MEYPDILLVSDLEQIGAIYLTREYLKTTILHIGLTNLDT